MGGFIDVDSWRRREHFRLYRGFANPFFSVCVDVDVSSLWRACREPDGPSFFLAALFCALRAANETEAMRLRIRGEGVWEHDRVRVSSTVLRSDETFGFARFELAERFDDFQEGGIREIERAKSSPNLEPAREQDDVIYHSTIPWIRFTSFSNPMASNEDSIPKLVFGKSTSANGIQLMPVAVEVHHGLVDGLDVARFFDRFQSSMASMSP
ncbi:MAG TPA: chloramphenicol acetyltransferase [Thermoanaerobaculia bacterium]|nr:chloramphenicol acetyltransferase [Thermoanaerobaculia bacterium]